MTELLALVKAVHLFVLILFRAVGLLLHLAPSFLLSKTPGQMTKIHPLVRLPGPGLNFGDLVQLKRRGEVFCGKVRQIRWSAGVEWIEVQTAIGNYSAPLELVRRCGGIDGRCSCEN